MARTTKVVLQDMSVGAQIRFADDRHRAEGEVRALIARGRYFATDEAKSDDLSFHLLHTPSNPSRIDIHQALYRQCER